MERKKERKKGRRKKEKRKKGGESNTTYLRDQSPNVEHSGVGPPRLQQRR